MGLITPFITFPLKKQRFQKSKAAAANTPTPRDPANPTLLKPALFSAGPGASEGVAAIDAGGLAEASGETGEGDGGEVTTVGDGALVGGVFTGDGADAGVVAAGDCTGAMTFVGGLASGDFEGDGAGGCAMVEATENATSTAINEGMLKRAITEKI
ncbi:hypothetical protein F2P56_028995 [Juglans regia]|uniref:Uncharacterized protein n=1 Tax=Juglans regia TaxID=51240 RepID=A0A833TGI0_JUGRE|nr:hypothetical protein F2P56_028995 [Juglans regia]